MERITSITFRSVNYILDWVLLSAAFGVGVLVWWWWYFGSLSLKALQQINTLHLVAPYLIFYGTTFTYLASVSAYRQSRLRSLHHSLATYLRAVSLAVAALALTTFFFPFIYIGRSLIVATYVTALLFLFGKEYLLRNILSVFRRKGLHVRKALILGDDEALTRKLLYESESDYLLGIDIVGTIAPHLDGTSEEDVSMRLLPVVGSVKDLVEILKTHCPDTLIIYAQDVRYELLQEVVTLCEERGLEVWIKLDMLERVIYRTTLHSVRGVPFISFHSTSQNHIALLVKYTADRIAAGILLLILSPLFLAIALGIRLTSKGPVLFSQARAGLNGRQFNMLKFRSMVVDAEQQKEALKELNEMQGPHFKIKNDPRITPIGRILRKTSLDELPQLWNVFRGEMSLVGPRPMDSREVDHLQGWHRRRLSMKPGITCIWQVAGRNNIAEFDDWAKLDLEYIDNWSLTLDIVLLLKTIPVVLLGRGAS